MNSLLYFSEHSVGCYQFVLITIRTVYTPSLQPTLCLERYASEVNYLTIGKKKYITKNTYIRIHTNNRIHTLESNTYISIRYIH